MPRRNAHPLAELFAPLVQGAQQVISKAFGSAVDSALEDVEELMTEKLDVVKRTRAKLPVKKKRKKSVKLDARVVKE